MKIGFDLDGVILDNTAFKVQKYKEIYNWDFEDWQLSSNIIDYYVPDRKIRRYVGKLAGTRDFVKLLDENCIDVFKKLKSKENELYIVSRRGKSDEGQKAAWEAIKKLNIGHYFDKIIFCETEDEKINTIANNNIDIFIDDRLEVIEGIYGKVGIPLLYDNFELLKKKVIKTDYEIDCVKNFEEIEERALKYETN